MRPELRLHGLSLLERSVAGPATSAGVTRLPALPASDHEAALHRPLSRIASSRTVRALSVPSALSAVLVQLWRCAAESPADADRYARSAGRPSSRPTHREPLKPLPLHHIGGAHRRLVIHLLLFAVRSRRGAWQLWITSGAFTASTCQDAHVANWRNRARASPLPSKPDHASAYIFWSSGQRAIVDLALC